MTSDSIRGTGQQLVVMTTPGCHCVMCCVSYYNIKLSVVLQYTPVSLSGGIN